MIELLRRVAAADPARVAVITSERNWTYGALAECAVAYAHGLHEAGIERFAVVSNDIAEIIALLAASSMIGAEACTYAPDITPEDLVGQAAALDHRVVITTRTDLDTVDLDVRSVASIRSSGDVPTAPTVQPLLVLTTGTTGTPRGVRHDWSRQLHRVANARDGAGQVWLLAYGPQQFAGLQVLIHVLGTGATLVAPPVRRPQAIVDDLHTHGVDHISATPTFWRFLLAELKSDSRPMPALRQITLGGEAAPAALLDELTAAFPDARISHIYAGSEFGSTGSVRDGHRGLPASLLEKADPDGVQLRIVDGELHVKSGAAMLGYHGGDQLPDDGWWPTGDLVEVVDDRIEFRGRQSDVINVGGVKIHPLPVEERVAAVPGVRLARAYGRTNALVGAVVALDVVPDGDVDERDLKARLREACQDLPRPAQPRSIRIVTEAVLKGDKLVRGTE